MAFLKTKILLILFLGVSLIGHAQSFIHSYVDPCTGEYKTIMADMSSPIIVTYYGQIKQFSFEELSRGDLEIWMNNIYQKYKDKSPCQGAAVTTTTTSTTTQAITLVNNITNITSLDFSSLTSAVGNVKVDVAGTANQSNNVSGDNNNNDDGSDNGGSPSANEQKQQKINNDGGTNTGNGNSGNSNNSSSNNGGKGSDNSKTEGSQNQSKTEGSKEGNQETNQVENGQQNSGENNSGGNNNTDPVNNGDGQTSGQSSSGSGSSGSGDNNSGSSGSGSGGSGNSGGDKPKEETPTDAEIEKTKTDAEKQQSQQATKSTSKAKTKVQKPAILVTGDIVGIQSTSDASQDARGTISFTRVKGDGSASLGGSIDYMYNAKIGNISLMRSWIGTNEKGNKHINVVSNSFTLLPGTWSNTAMFVRVNSLKKFTALYGVAGTYGIMFNEPLINTLTIGGFMYKGRLVSSVDATIIMVGVWSPYMKYYTESILEQQPIVIPFLNLTWKMTKTFGIGLTGGGTYITGSEQPLNYQVLLGAKLIL